MSEHEAKRVGKGTVLQAGIPKHPAATRVVSANGLLLRGVVTTTYVIDDANHPHVADDPVAVYCDVLCYSSMAGARWMFFEKAIVSQDRGGLHSGKVWKPRAATRDITGEAMDLNKGTNLANLDGDHVLVGFMDNSLNLPVVLKGLAHPKTDVGQEQETLAGHRLRLKVADGDPDFWKHRGAFYGVSDGGDFEVDLTQAYAADLAVDGKQPTPPDDGSTGNCEFKTQKNGEFRVLVDSGKKFFVKASEIAMGVENPADWMALASLVKAELQAIVTAFNSHGHNTTGTVGPSAVPGLISAPITPATGVPPPPTAVMSNPSNVKSATVKSE